ncbi:hypothetical protein JCM10207_001812 [Rhodosporidiobolus poonsookiae]
MAWLSLTLVALLAYGVVASPVVAPRDAAPAPTHYVSPKYTYAGCYKASPGPFVPKAQLPFDKSSSCLGTVNGQATLWYAAQSGGLCYAFPTLPSNAVQVDDSFCATGCTGDMSQTCGGGAGSGYWDLYAKVGAEKATINPDYAYKGCYSDIVDGARSLPNGLSISSDRTIEGCLAAATKAGYSVAALSYGQECWAADALSIYSSPIDAAKCKTLCKDKPSSTCGGSAALQVYYSKSRPVLTGPTNAAFSTYAGYTYDACYSDLVGNKRSLTKTISNPSKTVEGCLAACQKGGYQVCALSYYSECWVGAELSAASTTLPESSCHFPCAGNPNQMCGGNKALGVWRMQLL